MTLLLHYWLVSSGDPPFFLFPVTLVLVNRCCNEVQEMDGCGIFLVVELNYHVLFLY